MNKTITLALTAAIGLAALTDNAFADTRWQRSHPRREQVNQRLAHQNRRITNEVREGELTHAQAANLRAQDRQIRGEERAMAGHDGGHITTAEQRALNQQENAVSQQIGQ